MGKGLRGCGCVGVRAVVSAHAQMKRVSRVKESHLWRLDESFVPVNL